MISRIPMNRDCTLRVPSFRSYMDHFSYFNERLGDARDAVTRMIMSACASLSAFTYNNVFTFSLSVEIQP